MLSRRNFLNLAGGVGAGLALSKAGFSKEQFTEGEKPNIILIFTDDQGYNDLGCFGSPNIKTPNIDLMATEGAKFTDFYTPANVCSPSRMALLTGCYPARVGMTEIPDVFWGAEDTGINPDETTIAELLKSQGYATTCLGKWHVGGQHDIFNPLNHGFDEYLGINLSNSRHGPLYRDYTIIEKTPNQNEFTERFTDEAIDFIDRKKDNPFFVYLPYTMPHTPIEPGDDFLGTSDEGIYGDAVEELDFSVGRIIAKLKELNIDEKTLIVFTSDNGPEKYFGIGGNAEPLSGGKYGEKEGGHRMPCVMRWPGTIPAGLVCSEIASTMDLYKTFAYISGATVPSDRVIDGKNIYPLITAEPGAVSEYEYFLYFERWGQGEFRALRKGKWKVGDNWGTPRLYDLEADPGETTDLYKSNKELGDELFALYKSAEADIMANRRFLGNINGSKIEKEIPTSKVKETELGKEIGSYYNLKGQRVVPNSIKKSSKGIYFRKTMSGKYKRISVK